MQITPAGNQRWGSMTGNKLHIRAGRLAGIGLVNVATLAWATNMALGRLLRNEIGPLTLAAARFVIASACFSLLLRRLPPAERRLGSDRWRLAAMALVGVVLFGPTLYLGLRFTSTVNATLINGLGPLITGLLATLLLAEAMSGRQVAGALIGLVGIAALVSAGAHGRWQGVSVNVGDLIVLAAVGLWSLYSVLGQRVMRQRSALVATGLTTLMGTPLLVLAAIWEQGHLPLQWSGRLALAVLYIGIVPTVIGFLSWNAGIRRLGPSGAMVFYNTLPLYGALIGWIFMDEQIGVAHLVGGLLVIGGGILAARERPARSGAPSQVG